MKATNLGIFQLPAELWDQIQAHLRDNLPDEACGLIGGTRNHELHGWKASRIFLIENILHSPTRFRMDGRAQLAAFEQIDRDNLELIAIFHSHPQGPDYPSETDKKEFYYPGVIQLICYLHGDTWECAGFQFMNNEFKKIEVAISQ
jgi:proteasome lid subunit RPN8/RPN11